MKQAFEWLREEIEANSVSVGGADIIGTHNAMVLVNQAEAKWEAEACEWKYDKGSDISYPHYTTTCGNSVKNICSGHTYCGYCGKPIKISEVE